MNNIQYKASYLSDGTKVKITHELFNQLKQWEMQSIHIPIRFKNELKIQDNDWLNSNRRYYRHNTSLELLKEKNVVFKCVFSDTAVSVENIARRKIIATIFNILDNCTQTQKRRFLKHFMCEMSYTEIAKQENCTKQSINEAIHAVERILTKCEHSKIYPDE